MVVGSSSTSIVTSLNANSITVGNTDFDTATLSGFVGGGSGGTVTYTAYSDSACSANAQAAGTKSVSGSGGVPNSDLLTFNSVGTFYWQAVYSGDSNNSGAISVCTNEPMTVVAKAAPTITTIANPATGVTGTAHPFGDTATLAGAAAPTGLVTFTLYSNTACTAAVPGISGAGAITTSAGVSTASFSTSWTPTTPGVYYWIALYPGDNNNGGYTTSCQAANESVTVANAVAPTLRAISQTAGPDGGGAIVTLTGANLIGTTEVDFGSQHVTATGFHGYPCGGPPVSAPGCFGVIGSTLISVFTPASAAGLVDVTVINPAGSATLASAYTFVAPTVFTALRPFRICDTRSTTTHTECSGSPLGARQTRNAQITGVVVNAESVPSTAQAVVVNLTVINHGGSPTYVTAYPAGGSLPLASNVSVDGGAVQANLAIVRLGPTGAITLFNSTGSADVIADVQGYFAPTTGSTAGEFHSLAPIRVCDTRANMGTPCATTTSRPIVGGTWRRVVLSSTGGIPADGTAAAAVFNLTATAGTKSTYLAVAPPITGDVCPVGPGGFSNLNPKPGSSLPNRVISPLGPSGDICVFNAVGSINMIIDVNGWFGTGGAPAGASFYSTAPTRVCDTRGGCGGAGALTKGATRKVPVAGVKAVPADGGGTVPIAVVANLTGIAGTASTYLELYPADKSKPNSSDLNPVAHDVIANLAIVGLSRTAGLSPGDVNLFNSLGTINAILDVAGWFQ